MPKPSPSRSGQLELADAPMAIMPDAMPAVTDETMENEVEKRDRERSTSPSSPTNQPSSRDKVHRIFNIVVGKSGDDKAGGIRDAATYEEEMKKIAEEYASQQRKGRPFVHMRGAKSSNRDLKAIGEAFKGEELYRVNLNGKDGGSVLVNARRVEELLEEHDCRSS